MLAVVDPRILIRAHIHPHGAAAKLLALFAYGRVSERAAGGPHDDLDEMISWVTAQGETLDLDAYTSLREWADRAVEEAKRRKAAIERALEQHSPSDLLLALSPPVLDELVTFARTAQGDGHSHVQPDRVRYRTLMHAAKALPELGPAPFYLGSGRVSAHEYLIYTAVVAEARVLITDDEALWLPGDAAHVDQATRRRVRPYSLDEFISDAFPYNFKFDDIDAAAVLRAASEPLDPPAD